MERYLIICCLIFISVRGSAQYFQFSQYNYSQQRITPTDPVSSDYAKLALLYRNQGTGGGINLNSSFVSGSYPLMNRKTGKRWSGIGVSLMDDRSGGIFKVQEASLSYAVNIFLRENQTLSLGFKGLYQTRKIDLSELYTGLQYMTDRGFNPNVFNGENFGNYRSSFVTFSSGISWQQVNTDGVRTAYWNFSLFDFNKPQDSFTEVKNTLNSTMVASAGFRAYKRGNFSIFPEVLYTKSASSALLTTGLVTRCDVKGTRDQAPFYIDIISKYAAARSVILGMQFHNDGFSFGLSYDALARKNNVANLGAFEIGLELRRLVEPAWKTKLLKAKATQKTTASTKPAVKPTPVKKPASTDKSKTDSTRTEVKSPAKTLSTSLQNKRDSVIANARAGNITHEPFVLDKVILHFNFQFNSSELDEASTKYLDDLVVALTDNDDLRIKLSGHTDNIGSAKFNQRLSLHRTNTIKEYLISKGIDGDRIETEGKGMADPLNDNKTEEDRAKNRRVELTILYTE
jgi:type IX secretion system PorP/SprF family membrane protein